MNTTVANDYVYYAVPFPGGFTAGTHSIKFCTAYDCRPGSWTWTGTPDLELTDIYPPSSTGGGQDSTLTAKITNIGNADAAPFYVALYIDGGFVNEWLVSGGLPALHYTEFSVTIPGVLVAGSHSIEFYADHHDSVAESDETNNSMTKSFTWTGTPDLELTDIYPPSSTVGGQDSTLTARITNIGYADADSFYVALYIDGGFVNEWSVSGGLPALHYTEFSVTIPGVLVAGSHSIEFYADHHDSVAESDETNNGMTKSFTWTGTPDLELTDIYSPSSTVGGRDSTLTARITNIGYADADSFYVALYIDGGFVNEWSVSGGLPALYYTEFSVTIPGGLVAGSHSIEFVADYGNYVAESDETNNVMTKSFTWTGTPDLELTDIYQPTSLNEGEDTTITTRITNIGYADAGPFSIAMFIDGEYIDNWLIDTLPAWYYLDFGITLHGGLPAGNHSIQFIADYYDQIIENESNNSMAKSWTWTGPFPPSGIAAVPGPQSGQATVSWNWNGNPYISYYRIYVGTTSGTYTRMEDSIPVDWYYGVPIADLSNDTTYYFAMTTVNIYGIESGLSSEVSATPVQTGDDTPPSAPSDLIITDPGNGADLQLTWTASTDTSGIAYYLMYRLTNGSYVSDYYYDSGFPKFASGTGYTDSGLSDTDVYYYKVQAVDNYGNVSALSNLAYAAPVDYLAPSAPSAPGISAENGVVFLWWTFPATNTDGTALTDLAGFNIYRGTSSGNYGPNPVNGTIPVTVEGYMDQGVTNGQTYYYVIRAVDDDNNEGPASSEVSGTPLAGDTPPAPPAGLSITERETSLELSWSPNYENDIAGYNVYRGATSGYYPEKFNAALVLNEWFIDETVATAQTYYYVVTAVDLAGYESGSSNEVSGQTRQPDIRVIAPTASEPAVLDFVNAPSVIIEYGYNSFGTIVSEITLDIIDSDSGEIVFTLSEWDPPLLLPGYGPYFIWDGKYLYINKCVPDGWYDVKLSLRTMGLIVPDAYTIERSVIRVSGCDTLPIDLSIDNNQLDPGNPYVYINSAPQMPQITAKLKGGGSGTVNWELKIEYLRDNRRDDDIFTVTLPADSTWNINEEFGTMITGGRATITWEHVGVSPAQAFTFYIRGVNPTESEAAAYIGTTPWFIRGIAKQESGTQNGRSYLQFNEIGPFGPKWSDYKQCPNWGPPHGWGMMQVEDTNASLSPEILWNWNANIDKGKYILQQKHDDPLTGAHAFWTQQVEQFATWKATHPDANPPENTILNGYAFAYAPTGTQKSYEDAIWIKQYNGAYDGNYIAWDNVTDPDHPVWVFHRLNNSGYDYVEKVCNKLP